MVERRKAQNIGTYLKVNLDKDSVERIKKFFEECDLPNPIPLEKLHVTVVYSRKPLPKLQANPSAVYIAKPVSFAIWKSPANRGKPKDTNGLVLKLDSPILVERHKYVVREFGATVDFDTYIPHITFSYDVGDLDLAELPTIDLPNLVLSGETSKDLDLDWTPGTGAV